MPCFRRRKKSVVRLWLVVSAELSFPHNSRLAIEAGDIQGGDDTAYSTEQASQYMGMEGKGHRGTYCCYVDGLPKKKRRRGGGGREGSFMALTVVVPSSPRFGARTLSCLLPASPSFRFYLASCGKLSCAKTCDFGKEQDLCSCVAPFTVDSSSS